MNDSWLNIGYEDDRLLPYKEPEQALQNPLLGKLDLFCCEQLVVDLLTQRNLHLFILAAASSLYYCVLLMFQLTLRAWQSSFTLWSTFAGFAVIKGQIPLRYPARYQIVDQLANQLAS